jgi:hypothetical protein
MASTYSNLKIELIGTGEQSGTWGTTTNNNLGNDALGEAITGSADVTFASANVTVTLTDTNASQTARNLRLNLIGTTGGARDLILGSGCQIDKLYLINNTCADAITVKNTSGSGIAVPAGKTMFVFNNGTNVVDATTHLSSLTLGTALPIASGGTGSTSTTYVNLASNVTGTLPVANGGTGATSQTAYAVLAGGTTSTGAYQSVASVGTSGQVLTSNGAGALPTFQTVSGGVTSITGTANQVIASASTGAVTLSTPQSIGTASGVQFGSFGVGTASSGTTGEIRATNNVTAFYTSDIKFKENVKDIPNALDKVNAIGGKLFDWTDSYIQERGGEDGYFVKKSDFGVIAQDIQAVFPEAVRVKPDETLAVDYEKLSALAFAAIKELSDKVKILEAK